MHKLLAISLLLLSSAVQADTNTTFKIPFEDLMKQKVEQVPVKFTAPDNHGPNKPAVIFISGCHGGYTDGGEYLIKELLKRGIAVAELQSLSLWGRWTTCTDKNPLTGAQRAEQTYRARDELVRRGLVKEDNVGLLGFSHGGWTISYAMFLDGTPKYDTKTTVPFAAAVAFYPYCQTNDSPTFVNRTATLMLVGERDTWTHPSRCRQMARQMRQAEGEQAPFELVSYENATHSYDNNKPGRTVPTVFGDSYLEYDRDATTDSIARTLAWYSKFLKN